MNKRIIIGLTGPFSSGCTRIAHILEKLGGWHRISLSDLIKENQSRAQYSINELQNIGNSLRKADFESGNSGGILVRDALVKATDKIGTHDIVIECIKNPAEIVELKTHLNAYVIAVIASLETRWERLRRDKKITDYEIFLQVADRDKNENIVTINKDRDIFYYGQEVQKCVDLADIVIKNDQDFDDDDRRDTKLLEKITEYIRITRYPGFRRPTNEELMMNNAYCTSLRSECLKRQVGAIIVINKKYVVSTGYNTVPEGLNECFVEYEQKCYREKKINEQYAQYKYCPNCGKELTESLFEKKCPNETCRYNKQPGGLKKSLFVGKGLDLCRALHAEESAILQSSHLGGGVSLRGATLYTTTFPCNLCAKKIIAAEIGKVIYIEPYPMQEALKMLKGAGVKIEQFEGVKAQSFFKLFKRHLN